MKRAVAMGIETDIFDQKKDRTYKFIRPEGLSRRLNRICVVKQNIVSYKTKSITIIGDSYGSCRTGEKNTKERQW